MDKQEKLKKKMLKEKEGNIIKSAKEKRSALIKNKKNILSEIKDLKTKFKTETDEKNVLTLREKIEDFKKQLKEVENSIHIHDMNDLQEKLQIKKEKL